MKNILKNKDQQGQALLFVIAAMSIALALGVNISMRTLSSVSRTTRTDTSARVLAAAEGGAERVLNASTAKMKEFIASSTSCGLINATWDATLNSCIVNFLGADFHARAKVSLLEVSHNAEIGTTEYYTFKVEQDSVTQVNVTGLSAVTVCFTPVTNSDLYTIAYGTKGGLADITSSKKLISSGLVPGPYAPGVVIAAGASANGFIYCNSITQNDAVYSSKMLRIRSIGGDSRVGVFPPSGGSLPNQGFEITSIGELVQNSFVKVAKKVNVFKSYPYLPGVFDFGVFSPAGWSRP
jgi:hypothetical protein